MKKLVCFTAYLIAAAMLLPLCACTQATGETETEAQTATDMTQTETQPETTAEQESGKISPEEGETVSLLSELMTEWSIHYKRSSLDDIFDYTERCEPVPVHFSWSGEADYSHLLISVSPDMSDAEVYLCSGNELDVEDLLPGTEYFWQTAVTKDGVTARSDIHSFKTLQTVRTVYIPGVSNVRDIGGKTTFDGKRVKYNMAFRGADFAKLTDEGVKKAVDVLGIKTELDLREKVVNGTSPLGKDVKYISVTAPYYGLVNNASYKDALLTELRAFADPDNFPIYFHCSLGRDRTGTLAYILLTLLGADENDIYMDYETSFFSDMGGYVDNAAPSVSLSNLDNLRSIVSTKKNRYEHTRKYLIKLGMTDEELDAIRANLLEDVK